MSTSSRASSSRTDGGKTYTAGVYPGAEEWVENRFGKDIQGFNGIRGAIKPGETKRGVAVFKSVDPAADKLVLFVQGLTGDYKMEKGENGKLSPMYRTLKIAFYRPGDAWEVAVDPVTLESKEWIWRD